MNYFWVICVAVLVALTSAEEAAKCVGVTDEQLTGIKENVVKEDIDDKLSKSYYLVYGPKEVLDQDEGSCLHINFSRNGDVISYDTHVESGWVGGKRDIRSTLHKIANGIYESKDSTGATKAVLYFLAASDKHITFYECWTELGFAQSKLKYATTIAVTYRPQDAPLVAITEKAADRVNAHKDHLGEVESYSTLC